MSPEDTNTNTPPRKSSDKKAHLNLFRRFKHFNLYLSSPGVLAYFFLSFCFVFCIFFLDYRTVTSGLRLRGEAVVVTWLGFNGSDAGTGSAPDAEAGGGGEPEEADLNEKVAFLEQGGEGCSDAGTGSAPEAEARGGGEAEEADLNEKVAFLEQGGEGCQIFEGNWTWDETYPLYQSENCPFSDEGFRCSENGRPDHFYTKWRWQPKDCNLPRFDAELMLEKLRNRRLAFIGDSIGRNQWESLLCMLSSAVPDKTSIYEVNGNSITKHDGYWIFKFRHYNCTIEYYRAPFIVVQGHPPARAPSNVRLTLKLDRISWTSSHWKDADVLVFNSGHWWSNGKTIKGGCYFEERGKIKLNMTVEAAFQRSIQTLVRWISREVNLAKTLVFFRSYAPVHYRGGDWKSGGRCHLETLPELGEMPYEPSTEARVTTDVLMKLVKKYRLQNVKLLNVTEITARRKDGHSSLYQSKVLAPIHRQDCSHWCLPGVPDTWNELLYAVFLRREITSART